jgi:hypothetical protein
MRVAVPLLLVVGAQLWLTIGKGLWGRPYQWQGVIVVALLALVPFVRWGVGRVVEWTSATLSSRRGLATWGVTFVAFAYLVFTAIYHGHHTEPIFADDFSYRLQVHMLAGGQLWAARHEPGGFFLRRSTSCTRRCTRRSTSPGARDAVRAGVLARRAVVGRRAGDKRGAWWD